MAGGRKSREGGDDGGRKFQAREVERRTRGEQYREKRVLPLLFCCSETLGRGEMSNDDNG